MKEKKMKKNESQITTADISHKGIKDLVNKEYLN